MVRVTSKIFSMGKLLMDPFRPPNLELRKKPLQNWRKVLLHSRTSSPKLGNSLELTLNLLADMEMTGMRKMGHLETLRLMGGKNGF